MKKLLKYLRPFAASMLMVFLLLFLQALCDLNLPNYMSDIVNVGIQQNGIASALPDEVSAGGFSLVLALTGDESDRAILADLYSEDGGQYRLTGGGEAERARGEALFEDAATLGITIAKGMSAQYGGMSGGTDENVEMDVTMLYQLAPMLGTIPQDQMAAYRAEAQATTAMMKTQYGVAFVEGYYRELGLDMAGIQRGYIIGVGLKMLLIALIGGVATVLVGLFSSKMAAGVARKLRRDVFGQVERFSSAEVNRFGAASLITRTTNDVQQVQMLIQMGTRMILYSPIMCIGGIMMALRKSTSMSWIIALAGVVLIGLIVVLMGIVTPKFKIVQKLVDKLNLVAREHLSGLMVIRAFGTTEYEEKRFDTANRDLSQVNLFINRVMSLMMPIMTLIMSSVTLLIVWVGAHQIAASAMQVGDMMAFMQYAMQIIMSFLFLSMAFVFVPRAAVSMDRIAEVLDTAPSIVDPDAPVDFVARDRGIVRFEGVGFKYEGAEEYALRDISFTALPGQTTAIIGSTGSGKSTIANLILRFYDATEGQVTVDGANVKHVAQRALRAKIGYVPQKGVLLSGTIESNLRYGNEDISDEALREVAGVAQALAFIDEKPEGMASAIAQGGDNVSGGQKQRLSIARALAKRPEIFIFDDSFSALDFKTDVALRKALNAYAQDGTMIIVAQRVSTILHAEQILVLDEGRIVGRGTHGELLKTCPAYREIAGSQLSEEELGN